MPAQRCQINQIRKSMGKSAAIVSPNSALQRAGTHKVLGRGRPSVIFHVVAARPHAQRPRPAAELGS
jgi:superfamily II RNA helicase